MRPLSDSEGWELHVPLWGHKSDPQYPEITDVLSPPDLKPQD